MIDLRAARRILDGLPRLGGESEFPPLRIPDEVLRLGGEFEFPRRGGLNYRPSRRDLITGRGEVELSLRTGRLNYRPGGEVELPPPKAETTQHSFRIVVFPLQRNHEANEGGEVELLRRGEFELPPSRRG